MAQLHVELDEAAETSLALQASDRGLLPEQLAGEFIRIGLDGNDDALRERKRKAIEAMKRDRQGRSLGLDGMSMREFAHLDHKY